jgi:N-acetylmuramoyl-L-alanine amidase
MVDKMSDEILDDSNEKPVPPSPRRPARFSVWHAVQTLVGIAIVMATLFTMWTPANLFSNNLLDQMMRVAQSSPATVYPTLTPSPRLRVGIVSGHMGHDSGAVCPDGLTEAEVNYKIASMLQTLLRSDGFDVDLLEEFDGRLTGYQATALISIHNDSCIYYNDQLTGFKVAAAADSTSPESARKLTSCLIDRYAKVTSLRFNYNTITKDMTDYHAFGEINKSTTAAIIEAGFLATDRQYLLDHTDKVAEGIREGILCFVRNESISATPTTKP